LLKRQKNWSHHEVILSHFEKYQSNQFAKVCVF
jgi:hypothetical protein